jgi:hypothetical protein
LLNLAHLAEDELAKLVAYSEERGCGSLLHALHLQDLEARIEALEAHVASLLPHDSSFIPGA